MTTLASQAPQSPAPQAPPVSPAPPAGAQPATPPGAAQDPPTFRASTRLIVQNVTVKDADGRTVPGLTAADFVVVEDNEPQTVAFVEYQQLDTAPASADTLVAAAAQGPPPSPGAAAQPVTNVAISTPEPGNLRYQNRRLLVLYFDQSAMPQPDQLRAYENARKFLDTQMAAADMVAVMSFQDGIMRVRQDFTDNRAALHEVINVLQLGDDLNGDGSPDSDGGSAFGQGDAEFSVFNTDRQLAALQTAVGMLRALPEQKTLIYFGSGLRLNGSDNMAQLRATTNAALRSNVTINPIDARGLTATAPLGDATRASTGGQAMFSGSAGTSAAAATAGSQDTLFALARDTGGKAMIDYNDLSVGIAQAAEAVTDYYVVGYYTSHTADDGKFRRVRITVPSQGKAQVAHRLGYYADKSFANFNEADKERQLEEAFMLENPVTDITIAMELNYFQLNRAEYYVPVSMKIPGSELTLARGRGAARTRIDFIGEIKDEYGITIQNIRDFIDVRLSDADASQLAQRPVQYENGYVLLPGKYVIKVLARDATTGRIGTYQTPFVVPNLVREAERVPISSVVLSSQRVPLGQELFTVKQDATVSALNPLVHDGQKLVPSVTRVFSASRDLFVYLEAYQRDAASMRPLVAVVSFYRGDGQAFQTPPMPITGGMDPKSKSIPVMFNLPLRDVEPGRYDCQVTVLDPEAQKAAFWRMPLVILP